MTAADLQAHGATASAQLPKGLFRTVLAGTGRTLVDAFAQLESAPDVQRATRHPQRDLFGARVTLAPEEGRGYWEFTRVRDELYVVVENFAYTDPRVELFPGDGLVQFYFKLSGDLSIGDSRTKPVRLNRPALVVLNQPYGVDLREWTEPSAYERCVALNLRPQFLMDQLVPLTTSAPKRLLRTLAAENRDRFDYCQLPLTAQMFEAVTRIVNNPFTGPLALLYTEALSLELLCCAIAGFCAAPATSDEYTPRDLRRLHAARDFLMHHLTPVPTIREVARAAGMNETYLKRGFRAVFGETLFEFSVRCRMQHALSLLRDQRVPVSRAAEATGYRHQTSFATAFLRHFGVRPKDVRRGKPR